jgi:hypothetical protein
MLQETLGHYYNCPRTVIPGIYAVMHGSNPEQSYLQYMGPFHSQSLFRLCSVVDIVQANVV